MPSETKQKTALRRHREAKNKEEWTRIIKQKCLRNYKCFYNKEIMKSWRIKEAKLKLRHLTKDEFIKLNMSSIDTETEGDERKT